MSLWFLFWYFFLYGAFTSLGYNYTTNSKLAILALFIISNVIDAHSTAFVFNRDKNGYLKEGSFLIRRSAEKWGTKGVVIVKLLVLPFCFIIWLNPSVGLAWVCLLFYAAINNYRLYFKYYGRR